MKKIPLGDELRKKTEEDREAAQRARIQAERERYKRDRPFGKKMADEIIATLPDKLREAQKNGSDSVCALEATWTHERGFGYTDIQSIASSFIYQWALDNKLNPIRHNKRRYEGGEDPDSLWIKW